MAGKFRRGLAVRLTMALGEYNWSPFLESVRTATRIEHVLAIRAAPVIIQPTFGKYVNAAESPKISQGARPFSLRFTL
jgi:hypothetical protein